MKKSERAMSPYTVRQMKSGYNGSVTYLVFRKGQRVSVHAHITRVAAQVNADVLNIMELVKPYSEDPRPYDAREADAHAAYFAAFPERRWVVKA